MRLARKFVFALVVGILIVLGVNAAYRLRREIALFETDSRRDGLVLGRVLGGAVERTWSQVGETQALDLVEDANERQRSVLIMWVWLEGVGEASPLLSDEQTDLLLGGEEVVFRRQDETAGAEALYTFVPVSTPGGRRGAISIKEVLAGERVYIQNTFVQALITTGAMVAVCGALAGFLGVTFVGRPIHLLVQKARRVGEGDLSGRLELHQRDEIGDLAEEMNAMCDQLARAKEDAARESAARVAAVEQLRHADRLTAVGQIGSGIAHELGTPLNVVSGRAQMIANEHPVGTLEHDNAVIIIEQARRMTVIIRQLLDFARRRQAHKAPVDLRSILHKTLGMVRTLGEKQGVSIQVSDTTEAVADVDGDQIQQALTNLIINGIQSMPRGGTLSVDISRRPADSEGRPGRDTGYVCISVRDEGGGMTEDVRGRIFEPFFTTKRVGEGTGLGLPVTRDIVREHGGWIDIETEVGVGSCFSVYLPGSHRS